MSAAKVLAGFALVRAVVLFVVGAALVVLAATGALELASGALDSFKRDRDDAAHCELIAAGVRTGGDAARKAAQEDCLHALRTARQASPGPR